MTTPQPQQELAVDPVRVINILKARLAEEMAKSAVTEAALQESREREAALVQALHQATTAAQGDGPQDDG